VVSIERRDIPEKYDHERLEREWAERWESWDLYRWDPTRPRHETYVVDTPPPTVSGSLHIGHVFSYTQQDLIVRYKRMRGMNICYPIGWDDNGLPTERRTQNIFGVRPNPNLPYDTDWKPRRDKDKKDPVEEISRRNFVDACGLVCEEDEQAFEELWRRVGLSVDWSLTYATIDDHCQRISQISFLDLVERGQVRAEMAPTMWDVDDRTAVAQAEVEDRERPGAYHDIRFAIEDGGEFVISTTRPELLGACIAVVAHPDDARYRPLFGKRAITPLFHAPVPILPAAHADPEKGTGILMVCTFGDIMDVEFWKQGRLPTKQLIGLDGRIRALTFGQEGFESLDPAAATAAHSEIEGLSVTQARKKMAELLAADGSGPGGAGAALVGEPKPITHAVKFYERGSRPLEFVPTRQWFVRLLDHKQALIEQGRKIEWHPPHMRTRYENWVEGLNQDWCISRQRYSGVPFPVWYPLDASGEPDHERPIYAPRERLPVDPMSAPPPGFDEAQRNQPEGFIGDPDVMDTWATSSLTPQIISHWTLDDGRHGRLFPADLRPQSHEIIRTWAFYTIVKAWMHEGQVPWHHIAISGWILDPDRKKMSKSKGNVVTPGALLDQHSSDAVRYWAARARLGADTAFDQKVFKIGKRLATKLFNVSRFSLMQLDRIAESGPLPGAEAITHALDRGMLAKLRRLVERATEAFEQLDYASALQLCEEAFWDFCDNYVELVKSRSYGEQDSPGRRSAAVTLELALRSFLRLFAPFLPYVTEEVWSWRFAGQGEDRSVHGSSWPDTGELGEAPPADAELAYLAALEVSQKIRGAKTQAKRSLRWEVTRLSVTGGAADVEALRLVLDDVIASGAVADAAVQLEAGGAPEGERFAVQVELATGPANA
jgi:valyl-tRNA synthetase